MTGVRMVTTLMDRERLDRSSPPCGQASGWLLRRPGVPAPRRARLPFLHLYEGYASGRLHLPPEALRLRYFFIGGLFSERLPGYFAANLRALRRHGLSAQHVHVDSDASVTTNADTLAATVLDQLKPGEKAVLIGHSKGGLDAHAALHRFPRLLAQTRALITLQSPHGGSPLATDFVALHGSEVVIYAVMEQLFGGESEAVTDLTFAAIKVFKK